MPICVLKRGDLCETSRENEARFLHQNEVNLRDRETKCRQPRFVPHAFAPPSANTKLDLRSPIFDRDK